MSKHIDAWHFCRSDKRLAHGKPLTIAPGYVYSVTGEMVLCDWGLHASERAIDALMYAPGPIICRVRLSGDILRGDDKLCARRREVLWMADASRTLHEFACDVAERALLAVGNSDPRSVAAIAAKRAWLRGEATDADLSAAESAAESAAWSAAESAAWSAAGSSPWMAAWSAAESAARAAPWMAAWSAARAAARAAQNTDLTARLMALRPRR